MAGDHSACRAELADLLQKDRNEKCLLCAEVADWYLGAICRALLSAGNLVATFNDMVFESCPAGTNWGVFRF